MKAVTACAHEPRRDLIRSIALVGGIVESQHINRPPRLIEGVVLLAEAVKVLSAVRGGADRGHRGQGTAPIEHLIAQHALGGKAQPRLYLSHAERLCHLEPVRHRI